MRHRTGVPGTPPAGATLPLTRGREDRWPRTRTRMRAHVPRPPRTLTPPSSVQASLGVCGPSFVGAAPSPELPLPQRKPGGPSGCPVTDVPDYSTQQPPHPQISENRAPAPSPGHRHTEPTWVPGGQASPWGSSAALTPPSHTPAPLQQESLSPLGPPTPTPPSGKPPVSVTRQCH